MWAVPAVGIPFIILIVIVVAIVRNS